MSAAPLADLLSTRGRRSFAADGSLTIEGTAEPDAPMAPPAAAGNAAALVAQAMAALAAEQAANSAAALDESKVQEMIEAARLPGILHIAVNDKPMGELPAMRHGLTETALQIVAQNIPLCLVGPAGSGKTTACEQIAAALGLPFYMDGAPSGSHVYTGFVDAHGRYQTTPFRQAFEHGGVYLADELDGATDPGAPLVLNAALANGHMPFPDGADPIKRHPDFRMIAACNTYGAGADRVYVGRTQLDGATLDRFAFLDWPYDATIEAAMCPNADWLRTVQKVRDAVSELGIRHVVSPRASAMGAKLLAAGVDRATVLAVALWKGLSRADIERISSRAGV